MVFQKINFLVNLIMDKKPKEELEKHKKNFYENKIINRKKTLDVSEKFSLENKEIRNNIFMIDINKFSGFEGHYLFSNEDPLVSTTKQLLINKGLKVRDSSIYNFCKIFRPKTCGDLYHCKKSNKLHKLSCYTFFHPWIHKFPTKKFREGFFGPKDLSSMKHRILRLTNLINNLKEYDYVPSNNDIIEGYILLKNDDYRFLITGGHHRVAVMTALHMCDPEIFGEIIVKFESKRSNVRIVKEDEVNNWPGVKSGYLNKQDALEMFNRYFN